MIFLLTGGGIRAIVVQLMKNAKTLCKKESTKRRPGEIPGAFLRP